MNMGGPDMAPHSPQRSARPGQAVARLDLAEGRDEQLHVPDPDGRARPALDDQVELDQVRLLALTKKERGT